MCEKTEKGYVVCEKCFWLAVIVFTAMACLIANLATQVYFMSKIERERAERFEKFAAFKGRMMAERFDAARRCEDMRFRDPMMMPCPRDKADFCRNDFMRRNNLRPDAPLPPEIIIAREEIARAGMYMPQKRNKIRAKHFSSRHETGTPEMICNTDKMFNAPCMPPAEFNNEMISPKDDRLINAPCPPFQKREDTKATEVTEMYDKAEKANKKQ